MVRSTRISLLTAVSVACAAFAVPAAAQACGGFFCDNIEPVVQTAERIMFQIGEDGRVTTFVEVQYQGPPSDFGWALPIPHVIDTADIETAPAGLFDLLEERTAPVFTRQTHAGYADDEGSSCGLGDWEGGGGGGGSPPDTSGVDVVGEAVVGPYAIEVITATEGDNLTNWLQQNGYQVPSSAAEPMDHYIDMGMAFMGIKLQADVPAGPIDALAFTYTAPAPMIPLILTQIAASPRMEIVAYVNAPGRYVPGNYEDLNFPYGAVSWLGEPGRDTDYLDLLRDEVALYEGQAFNTEFAKPVSELEDYPDGVLGEILPRGSYLTRFHTFMNPAEMTVDPYWLPDLEAPDIDNHHTVGEEPYQTEIDKPGGRDIGVGLWLLMPGVLLRRRRIAPPL